MKLASIKTGGRDGKLVVVNRDMTKMIAAPGIAPTMQALLEDWDTKARQLKAVYDRMEDGHLHGTSDFDPTNAYSPLPRSYHWVDGSAYVNHVELVRKARGAEMPESFWHDPLVYQGAADDLLGPRDDIVVASEDFGIDMESETAVITDYVPMSTSAEDAFKHIKLLMLVNDVSLRNLIPGELAKGFGFYQGKPATAFSPVAVTVDELGDAWDEGTVKLPMTTHLNGELLGEPECGVDMTFNFLQLIHHVTKTRNLGAGTIIGSGTISNYDRSRGSSCLAEVRMLETLEQGEPKTPFMKYGDVVRIEMFNKDGDSVFGAIEQKVVPATPA